MGTLWGSASIYAREMATLPMIKKTFLLLISMCSVSVASGPKFMGQKAPTISSATIQGVWSPIYQEFLNSYNDIKNVPNGIYRSSTMTLQGLTVDSITINSQQNGLVLGKIKQCVFSSGTDRTSTTSSSFQSVGLSVNITPTINTSTMVVIASGNLKNSDSLNGNLSIATVFRDSIDLGAASNKGLCVNVLLNGAGGADVPCSIVAYDSPGDKTLHNYAIKIRSDAGSNTTTWNNQSNNSYLIVCEISP